MKYSRRLVLFSLTVGVIFFFIGYLQLLNGFIHEDAYILFKYSNNFAASGRIVYNLGSINVEGATDFLWMVLIAAFRFIGVDAAIAALVLNSFGAVLAAGVYFKVVINDLEGVKTHIFYFISAFIILFSSAATAGYVGFSSMIFSALSIIPFAILLSKSVSKYYLIPIVSIILALVRPDGVILGVSYTILAFILMFDRYLLIGDHYKDHIQKRYIITSAIVFLIGAIYFFWRISYFENFLPLPLVVKSTSDSRIPGLYSSFLWLYDSRQIFISLGLIFILIREKLSEIVYLIILLFPVVIHQLFFLFAHQSQNVDFRFQSPVLLLLLLVVYYLLSKIKYTTSMELIIIVLITLMIMPTSSRNSLYNLLDNQSTYNSRSYIDIYSYEIGKILSSDDVLVLTEAGRLAYWTESDVIDVVGLNDPYSAITVPDSNYILSFNPAIVMMHIASSSDYENFLSSALNNSSFNNGNIININHLDLTSFVNDKYKFILELDDKSDYPNVNTTTVAPIKLLQFLDENKDRYSVYMVNYGNSFSHIYGFNKNNSQHDLFIDLLVKSFESDNYRGYLSLIK